MSTATKHANEHAHDDGRVHAHVSSLPFMVGIFLTLICLTVLTVAASYVDFGAANTVVAVLIATVKASLVAMFFMHLRYDKPLLAFIFVMAFVFLGVFGGLTNEDLSTRGTLDPENGVHVLAATGEAAPGGLNTAMMPQHAPAGHGHGGGTHSGVEAPGSEPGAAHGADNAHGATPPGAEHH